MKYYCTVDDVLGVAQKFKNDVTPEGSVVGDVPDYGTTTDTIPREDVEFIIYEASEMVRALLRPRYDIAVIDAYDPDYPPIVVYYTKTYAAILMYERYNSVSIEANQKIIESYKRSMKHYETIVGNGGLLDRNSIAVPTLRNPILLKGENNTDFVTNEKIKKHYRPQSRFQ